MENTKINVVGPNGSYVVREGEAAEMPKVNPLAISGNLSAPRNYLENKVGAEEIKCNVTRMVNTLEGAEEQQEKMYNHKQSMVAVNNSAKNIKLTLNQKSSIAVDTISGTCNMHEIWAILKVNEDYGWSVGALRKMLKRIKFYFSDKTLHSDLLEQLFSFTAKIQTEVIDKNVSGDFHKSKAVSLINKETIEFKIEAPIYVGFESKVVRVEVLADVSDGEVKYMLESQDLFELQEQLWEKYLAAELKFFVNNDILIITIG